MKLRVTFKTPDVLHHVTAGLSDEDKEAVQAVAEKYISHDEYITVEIDTEAGTCQVVPKKG